MCERQVRGTSVTHEAQLLVSSQKECHKNAGESRSPEVWCSSLTCMTFLAFISGLPGKMRVFCQHPHCNECQENTGTSVPEHSSFDHCARALFISSSVGNHWQQLCGSAVIILATAPSWGKWHCGKMTASGNHQRGATSLMVIDHFDSPKMHKKMSHQ